MVLIDTHTHIFGEQFENDLDLVMKRSKGAGVQTMLIPNVDVSSIPEVVNTISQYPETRPMWGLHPCSVTENWKSDLAEIEGFIEKYPPVGIGEIGLDFFWSKQFVIAQKEALEYQLNLALQLELPVSLHTREATPETIELVLPFAKKGLRGVFHCFSGSQEEAQTITNMGFMLGIGGTITFKNNAMRNWISQLDYTNSLVLETDAPYLAPVPYRGKRNEPAYLKEIAAELGILFDCEPEVVAEFSTRNAKTIFKNIN